jgi:hypothetical protein
MVGEPFKFQFPGLGQADQGSGGQRFATDAPAILFHQAVMLP